MKASSRLFFLLGMLMLLLPWPSLFASSEEPEIRDIVVTTSTTDLLLSASIQNAFPTSLLRDLHRGQPIVFTYQLKLVKVESWVNSTLVELTITRSLYYDQQRKLYQIIFPEQENRLYETENLEEVKKLMGEINAIRVTDLTRLIIDESYAIHLKMWLSGKNSKSRLQRLLSPSPDWETQTDWRTIEFRY